VRGNNVWRRFEANGHGRESTLQEPVHGTEISNGANDGVESALASLEELGELLTISIHGRESEPTFFFRNNLFPAVKNEPANNGAILAAGEIKNENALDF
jgi:hypothetical protein